MFMLLLGFRMKLRWCGESLWSAQRCSCVISWSFRQQDGLEQQSSMAEFDTHPLVLIQHVKHNVSHIESFTSHQQVIDSTGARFWVGVFVTMVTLLTGHESISTLTLMPTSKELHRGRATIQGHFTSGISGGGKSSGLQLILLILVWKKAWKTLAIQAPKPQTAELEHDVASDSIWDLWLRWENSKVHPDNSRLTLNKACTFWSNSLSGHTANGVNGKSQFTCSPAHKCAQQWGLTSVRPFCQSATGKAKWSFILHCNFWTTHSFTYWTTRSCSRSTLVWENAAVQMHATTTTIKEG